MLMPNPEKLSQALSAFELSADGVLACNIDGMIVYWSEGCENVFGYSKEDIEGIQTISLVVPSSSVENHLSRYIVGVATGNIPSKPMSAGRLVEGTTRDGKIVKFRIGLHRVVVEDEELAVAVLTSSKAEMVLPDKHTIIKWAGITGTAITTLFTTIQIGLKNVAPTNPPPEKTEDVEQIG